MARIPASHRAIFEGRNFAHIATLMKDGSPQVTPVWIEIDGDTIGFNTAEGRTKARNLDRDGRVAISLQDQANPYRYVQVRASSNPRRAKAPTPASTRCRRSTPARTLTPPTRAKSA